MFVSEKATDIMVYLLEKEAGAMSDQKLMRLVYLAERECLLSWGEPLTGDDLVSTPEGPALAHIQKRLCSGSKACPQAPLLGYLSRAEMALLDRVYERYHSLSDEEIQEKSLYPEWEAPAGEVAPIALKSLLMTHEKSEAQAEAIIEWVDEVDSLLRSREGA